MNKYSLTFALVIFVIVGFVYGFTLVCTLPTYDYLCKATIEGNEYCFHSDDGKYVRYYTKSFGIHNREGYIMNDNNTLEDDYEDIATSLRFYEELKCNN